MADKSNKVPENVAGAYYVDSECIGCGLCVSTAPAVFEMNSDDKAYVKKQPSPEDMDGVRSSMDACPVTAIGDDG
jgi:ferredoxin